MRTNVHVEIFDPALAQKLFDVFILLNFNLQNLVALIKNRAFFQFLLCFKLKVRKPNFETKHSIIFIFIIFLAFAFVINHFIFKYFLRFFVRVNLCFFFLL